MPIFLSLFHPYCFGFSTQQYIFGFTDNTMKYEYEYEYEYEHEEIRSILTRKKKEGFRVKE